MDTKERVKLSLFKKIGYGTGDVASNLVYGGIGMFIMIFWTNTAQISPAAAGTIMLVSRIFDGVSDVIIGFLVDRTKSKKGKCRPWIFYLALPFALSAMITFWTPSSSATVNIIYAFISYNITMTLYTAINIPYGLLGAKITDDQVERGVLGVFRGFGALTGNLIVALFAPALIQSFGYTITFAIIGILGSAIFFITYATTEEVVGATEEDEDVPIKDGLKVLIKNKAWIITLFVGLMIFTGLTLKSTATAYYAQYVLGDLGAITSLTLIGFPGLILGMGLASPCFKKLGKVNTYKYASFAMMAMLVVFSPFITSTSDVNITMLYAFIFLSSIVQGLAMSGFFPMLGDTIEYGEWKTGIRVEGVTYSAGSVSTKVGGGLGAAAVGWLLAASPFDPNLTVQSDATLNMIMLSFIVIPVVMVFFGGIATLFQDMDKLFPQIMDDLNKRKELKGEE